MRLTAFPPVPHTLALCLDPQRTPHSSGPALATSESFKVPTEVGMYQPVISAFIRK